MVVGSFVLQLAWTDASHIISVVLKTTTGKLGSTVA